jgi:putative endonuclease
MFSMDPIAKGRGRDAERRAARHLAAAGLEILARNLRTRSGEIDVVAREGATLVIVEVKYRGTHLLDAWRSLTRKKRETLLRAAGEARAALRIEKGTPVRFDVVLASRSGPIAHLRGALASSRPYDP